MMRLLSLLVVLAGLTACASGKDLDKAPAPLGNFKLGHNVVVAKEADSMAISRKVTDADLQKAVEKATEARFRRYNGDNLYHLGIVVDAYVLAPPGVPVVASLRSGLVIRVTVWDDTAGQKLNVEPHQITVVESTSGKTVLGSGLTQTKEEQLESLAVSAGKQIEIWLEKQKNEKGWFGGKAADGQPATPVAAAN